MLFVCKLNPVTDEEDLQLIFSRFDPNAKAEIIRDRETGDSLQVSNYTYLVYYIFGLLVCLFIVSRDFNMLMYVSSPLLNSTQKKRVTRHTSR